MIDASYQQYRHRLPDATAGLLLHGAQGVLGGEHAHDSNPP